MLPPRQHQSHTCFFNFAERRVYKLDNVLKGFDDDPRCAGSSHGWLIIFGQTTGNSFLFNPFSGVTIQLPSIKFLHQQDKQLPSGYLIESDEIGVTKAILTSDPSRTKCFTIVIIYGFFERLAFYTHGENSSWTLFGDSRLYWDILFHNDQLYVLPYNSVDCRGVYLEVWNFDNNFPKKVTRLEKPYDDLRFRGRARPRAYLMESMGKIFCVKRFTCYDEEVIVEKIIMNHFYVYKLDCYGKILEDVVTLGDEAIFVGRNQSVTVSARKFREWERDSIYFTAWKEVERLILNESVAVHQAEAYNLEDKALKPCNDTNMVQECDPTPFWIVPNPWSW